jgi:16S rRNA C967 or C1407 C5-methylase (RsmB/RsmF family)/NOL1/NOP2/fmu family ribosome biogenesis protein
MSVLLPDELPGFLASLDQPRERGLRLNPAKTGPGELAGLLRLPLEPVPWCRTGFSLPGQTLLGGHPARLAGLFYLQEPSAMSAAEALAPKEGWRVIDLAASPGGKTTHLASLVGPRGLVVANEVSARRLGTLHHNLDMWGSGQVVTASLPLGELAVSGALFDAALLDAPCSGEGMFRHSPSAIRDWSPEAVRGAARRQRRLLAGAARLVRTGGVLVYSTCTFELDENERRIAEFLADSSGWIVEDAVRWPGAVPGYALPGAPTERTARFWPHLVAGDGQFVARLRRTGGDDGAPDPAGDGTQRSRKRRRGTAPAAPDPAATRRAWHEFQRQIAADLETPAELLFARGDRLFLLPPLMDGLPPERLTRPGLPLGRLRPGRFEPHPALASALGHTMVSSHVSWAPDDPRLAGFLRGAAIPDGGADGWVLVCMQRWGVGWARRSGGVLKNMIPAHIRTEAARHRPPPDND